jgi:dehydrogenase/reductase SDR family member 1
VSNEKVAVVTGASRGIGKGIALALGDDGWTVYVTGRTVDDTTASLPGTVGATAAEITGRGGTGIAVPCDHHDDSQVQTVFERVRDEAGALHLLVNNAYPNAAISGSVGIPFWEAPSESFDEVIDVGLRAHYVASCFAVPLLLDTGGGLIVNVSSVGAKAYRHTVPYGVGKAALDKFTADAAHELRERGVAVVSLWPGLIRTELVLSLAAAGRLDIGVSESPVFVGRGVVALARDPEVMTRSGGAYWSAELARDYAFTEDDGTLPPIRGLGGA